MSGAEELVLPLHMVQDLVSARSCGAEEWMDKKLFLDAKSVVVLLHGVELSEEDKSTREIF